MSDRDSNLTRVSAVVSVGFMLGLGLLAWRSSSDLAFAQASDSLLDVVGAIVLAWTVAVGRQPRDPGHPMGHSRAEPLGALAIAGLSTLLAFEVGQSAIQALTTGSRPRLPFLLLAAFSAKGAVKLGIWLLARRGRSPALRALSIDAKNDIGVALVAVCGFFAARFGAPELDAWLALPLAVWIGGSGIELARENVDLLMGGAPSAQRQADLLALVQGVAGVVQARDLRAHFLGSSLSVDVQILVRADLNVGAGYELAEHVRLLLEAEEDVLSASVLIAPAEPNQVPA